MASFKLPSMRPVMTAEATDEAPGTAADDVEVAISGAYAAIARAFVGFATLSVVELVVELPWTLSRWMKSWCCELRAG